MRASFKREGTARSRRDFPRPVATAGPLGVVLVALAVLGGALPGLATAERALPPGLPNPAPATSDAQVRPAVPSMAARAAPAASVTPVAGATVLANIAIGRLNNTAPQPAWLAYDPADGDIYAPDFGSNNVTIIDAATNKVVASPKCGDDPIDALYDPNGSDVYVSDFGVTYDLSVYSGTSYLGRIVVGNSPFFELYDSANGLVYVSIFGNASVAVVSGLSLVTNIPVGGNPLGMAYDPTNGDIYVANSRTNNVTVISGSTNKVVKNINVGTSPQGIVYDPANADVYVGNNGGATVSVLSGTSLAATVNVSSGPTYPAYDPGNKYVYFPTTGNQTVDILSGTSVVANVSVGITPRVAIYSPATGEIYVANEASDNISVFNGTGVVASISGGKFPYAGVYDPNNSELYISEFNSGNVSVIGSTPTNYYVTFQEQGLTNGTAWGAALGETEYPANATEVAMYAVNGTYNYTVPFVRGYAQVPGGTVTVAGNDPLVNLTFVRTYPVAFNESGLPAQLLWAVTVDNVTVSSTNVTIFFAETNGTFAYSVSPVPGYATRWAGNFTVAASNVTVDVNFTPFLYPVDFAESGLAPSTPWSVDFRGVPAGGSGTVIAFSAPNGTYGYTIPPVPGYTTPAGGTTMVSAAPDTVNLTFVVYEFTVEFVEQGLPKGTNWSVTLGGQPYNTTASSLSAAEPNGTYAFSIATIGRFAPQPGSGMLTIDNSSQSVSVTFQAPRLPPTNYSVTFSESGLPTGRTWSIAWNGSPPTSSTGTTIAFSAPNGSYPFSVGAEPGYTTAWSGSVTVDGHPATENVSFGPFRYAVTFVETGLSGGLSWSVTLNGTGQASTAPSIVFLEPNGTFDYTVGYISGYAAVGAGSITVSGASPANITITFGPPTSAASGFPILPVAIGLVLVVAVVAIIALMARRRSRSGSAPANEAVGSGPDGPDLTAGTPPPSSDQER
jgi:YVTN family beta-propeller protein